jgi:hypothetical protein
MPGLFIIGLDVRSFPHTALFAVLGLLVVARDAGAAPHEIKVFTDELAPEGEQTLEIHANVGRRPPDDPLSDAAVLQTMAEYSYGIWKNWEASLQLPTSLANGTGFWNGVRAELQYVAPHNTERGFYWGANFEVGYVAPVIGPRFVGIEFTPILGYRVDDWHFVLNPGFVFPIGAGLENPIGFTPAAKIAYRVQGNNFLGFEYYVEAAPLSDLVDAGRRNDVLYLVLDSRIGHADLNFGIGKGLTPASDQWVIKAMLEFPF